jgi:hypothetical protein
MDPNIRSGLSPPPPLDPAGVFAVAHSLWHSIFEDADRSTREALSKTYNGLDQLMREVMRAGVLFET